MPVAGQDAITDPSARQWISHMRALVISCIDAALVLKQRDAASLDFDRFGSAFRNVFEVSHFYKVGLCVRHQNAPMRMSDKLQFVAILNPAISPRQTEVCRTLPRFTPQTPPRLSSLRRSAWLCLWRIRC